MNTNCADERLPRPLKNGEFYCCICKKFFPLDKYDKHTRWHKRTQSTHRIHGPLIRKGRVVHTKRTYKCQGCNYRVPHSNTYCAKCLCEEDNVFEQNCPNCGMVHSDGGICTQRNVL